MAPKRKKEAEENANPEQKGKADESKGTVDAESALPDPDVPKPWVNPLPLVTAKEVFPPLAQGEHQFISILNTDGNSSTFTRLQKLENLLDDPCKPPVVIQHYGGSSCDCYFKNELTHQHDLCESCREIWRRWNWKWIPPPPVELDPYANLLCVGDIDPHFQPTRGDIVIFHPSGPQAISGLRAEWGFLSSYKGHRSLELNQHDLIVRLGSFANSKNAVDYIPYDKVEVRAMTKDKQWRFLGGQAALLREDPIKPSPPVQPIAALKTTESKKTKKGKTDKKKDSPRDQRKEAAGAEKIGKKKKGAKETKNGRSGKDDNFDGRKTDVQVGAIKEFTLDGIPDSFNIIQKAPDQFIAHPGERLFRPYRASLTCNYKYSKPGMQCGMGEFLPRFGDIVIREPQAWMLDEWGDKKKRPKVSMVKWYKPSPWKRDLNPGMLLLRPYIDRYTEFLDATPQCEYTPLMWSQWGVAELYLFEGKREAAAEPIPIDSEAALETAKAAEQQDGKGQKRDNTKAKNREKVVEDGDKQNDATPKAKEKKADKKKEKNTGDDLKASKTSKKREEEANKNDLGENGGQKEDEPVDGMLWQYWGRSTHLFDEPYQFWALDNFCRHRHLRELEKLEHLDFFVEDTGVESDFEHAPKVEEVLPKEPEEEKTKGKSDKTKGKKDKQKDAARSDKKKEKT